MNTLNYHKCCTTTGNKFTKQKKNKSTISVRIVHPAYGSPCRSYLVYRSCVRS